MRPPEIVALQKEIIKEYPREIRLEKTKRVRKESLQEFLIKFFTEWNPDGNSGDAEKRKDTIYIDSREVQTKAGRRRSLGDIFMICRYYFPKLRLEDLLYELYIGLNEYFTTGYRSSYCYAMHKRTFYYNASMQNCVYNKQKHDEYHHPYYWYLKILKGEEVVEDEFDEEEEED